MTTPERPLRIVSYNVRYFGHALRGIASSARSKRGIAEGIASLDPLADIVCLQEVETLSLRSSVADRRRATPEETQLEAFMARLEESIAATGRVFPYEAFYFRADAFGSGRMPLYTTGLAILVNERTLRIDSHNAERPESITHHHVAAWKDRKQSRICAHMRLSNAAGQPVHVFNTHLSLPTPFAKNYWSERDKMGCGVNQLHEARALAAFVKRHAAEDPFIVCGDFNSPPGSPVYRYLTTDAQFVGAQEKLGLIDPDATRGFPTAGFAQLRMHLDHVFAGGTIRFVDMEGSMPFGDRAGRFHGLSDHVPLITRFRLTEK